MDGSNWPRPRPDQDTGHLKAALRSSAVLAAALLSMTLVLALLLTGLGVRATSEFDTPEQPAITANGS